MTESSSDSNMTSPADTAPNGISSAAWQKFQALKKRRLEVTKKSTDRRIKNLQDNVLSKVQGEFKSEEEKDILKRHNVTLPGDTVVDRKRKLTDLEKCDDITLNRTGESSSVSRLESEWSTVKQYIDINKHLEGVDKGKDAPKTRLEKKIDQAVSLGDLETAEKLSDHLATRNFGKKIADAIDARTFAEQSKRKEEEIAAKKKKKLDWGFDHKQRWETKSNM